MKVWCIYFAHAKVEKRPSNLKYDPLNHAVYTFRWNRPSICTSRFYGGGSPIPIIHEVVFHLGFSRAVQNDPTKSNTVATTYVIYPQINCKIKAYWKWIRNETNDYFTARSHTSLSHLSMCFLQSWYISDKTESIYHQHIPSIVLYFSLRFLQ